MKKVLALFLVFSLFFVLTACSEEKVESELEVELSDRIEAPSDLDLEGIKTDIGSGTKFSWEDNADAYVVYRGEDKEELNPVFRQPITENIYKDYEAIKAKEYYYGVKAIDEHGYNTDLGGIESVTADGYGGIKVHYKDTDTVPIIHVWGSEDEKYDTDWDSRPQMEPAGKDWYITEFPSAEELGIIFEGSSGRTGDLFFDQGDWWYVDEELYPYNPDGLIEPIIASDLTSESTYWGDSQFSISIAGPELTEKSLEINGEEIDLEDETTYEGQIEDYFADGETGKIIAKAVNETANISEEIEVTRDDDFDPDFTFYYLSEEGRPNIYTWYDDGEVEPLGSWPGTEMAHYQDNWYRVYLDDISVDELNVIFNVGDSQTDDLSREKGEWWYKDGDWHEKKPE